MTSETKKRIADINSGIIPEGYKKTKVGIVPVEWETTSLGNYIVEHTEKSTENNQYPVLTSSRRGIFLQSDYYNKQVASEDNTGYNVVPFGYFTYRHMSDDEVFRFNINNIVEKGIVSTLYPVFTTHNLDDNWLLNTLNNGHEFQKYALIQKQGGSRTYMYLEKLKKLKLAIPPLPEQQKIAEILGTQDKLIELQERKINQLKTLKKAYLQKMFPKKDSKYPELRFKGFTDAWEQRELDYLCELITVGIANSATHAYVDDGIVMFRNQNIKENVLDDSDLIHINKDFELKYENKRLKENDLLIARTGYPGTACVVPKKYEGSQTFTTLIARLKKEVNPYYVCQYLNSDYGKDYFLSTQIGGGQKNSGAGILEKFPLKYPTNIDEQKSLSGFFMSFDNLITLHQRKLDEEKQKKKALMQLLLTGKVRVKL